MFSKMGSSLFASLPTFTNAVEAYNRISKSSTPEPLNIAMLMTYKEDMLAALDVSYPYQLTATPHPFYFVLFKFEYLVTKQHPTSMYMHKMYT